MPRKKKTEQLTPIPRPRKPRPSESTEAPAGVRGETHTPEPDLSHISPDLRPLAVLVSELDFLPRNPRGHGEKDLKVTRGSLQRFTQVEVLVVNYKPTPPVVLNGNGRLSQILDLGWSHVAINRVYLDEPEARELAVTLNRSGELATWVKEDLDAALRMIETPDQDLAQMLTELAEAEKLIPKEPEVAGMPEIGATTTHTITLRYADEDEAILKTFIGQEGPEPIEPIHAGSHILERIKAIVAASADHGEECDRAA